MGKEVESGPGVASAGGRPWPKEEVQLLLENSIRRCGWRVRASLEGEAGRAGGLGLGANSQGQSGPN